jgi:integrase
LKHTRKATPKQKHTPKTVWRWWYRLAWKAGLVSWGVTKGFNPHRARDSFVLEMRRAAGIEHASNAAGHADISSTLSLYGHHDESDLEAAFETLRQYQSDQDG